MAPLMAVPAARSIDFPAKRALPRLVRRRGFHHPPVLQQLPTEVDDQGQKYDRAAADGAFGRRFTMNEPDPDRRQYGFQGSYQSSYRRRHEPRPGHEQSQAKAEIEGAECKQKAHVPRDRKSVV